ncbi:MAG: DUF1186 domain-containing protein [bacterium]
MQKDEKLKFNEKRLETLIQELYKIDCWIDYEKLRELISCGREAIPYLESILRSTLENRSKIDYTTPPSDKEWFLVIHALYLLAHLRAHESLDLVLEILSQKQEFLDYWLHDLLNDDIWEVVYYLGQPHLKKLEAFVLNQEINLFSRLTVCTALIQISAHNQAKRAAIAAIFTKVLDLENEDPDFIGLLASELLDIKDESLRPQILQALERHGVWPGIVSTEEVQISYKNKKIRKLKPLDIFQRYDFFRQYAYFAQTSPFKPLKQEKRRKLENHS